MEVMGDSNEMIEEGIRLTTSLNSATIKVPCHPMVYLPVQNYQ